MTDERLTVMVPAPPQGSTNLLFTPNHSPDMDRLQWRELVREWTKTVVKCAEGGEN